MNNHRRFIWLAALPFFVISACSQFRASDAQILNDFKELDESPTFAYLESGERTLRYMIAGANDQPRVLFIHGAPGSLDAFNTYFEMSELRDAAQLVSVDRPGYGYSDFGWTEPDLALQAQLICPLVLPGTILVGHSYGGTVAARLAMDHPDLVGGLILIAPSLSPEDERIFFFNRPMERKIFNWMLPTSWKVSNTEKLAWVRNLEAMVPLWAQIAAPVTILHGTRDGLVSIEHSRFAAGLLPAELTTFEALEGEGHAILWTETERVSAAILGYL